MPRTCTPYLRRRSDGTIVCHGVAQPQLVGYERRPLAPRQVSDEPTYLQPPSPTAGAPEGLVDVHTAAAITGIPALVLAEWAQKCPERLPALRFSGIDFFFDPALLNAVAS
jgi:hypothetical protein